MLYNTKEFLKSIRIPLRNNLAGWLMMFPSIILFAFFIWMPLISNIRMSFYDNQYFEKFVGFDNYLTVLEDPLFRQAFTNTFVYIGFSLLIGFVIPIIIGLVLSEGIHFRGFFRIMIYFPAIISGIAVAFIFKNMYSSESYSVINSLLLALNFSPSLLRDDSSLVIPLIVVAMTWRGAGATVLIYLATMQSVDNSLYDAVRVDGGGMFRRITAVTLPHIKNTVAVLLILQVISVFQVFNEPLVIGVNGGPNGASMSMMLLSYLYAFANHNPSQGAAIGVILAVIIISITLIYFGVNRLLNGDKKR